MIFDISSYFLVLSVSLLSLASSARRNSVSFLSISSTFCCCYSSYYSNFWMFGDNNAVTSLLSIWPNFTKTSLDYASTERMFSWQVFISIGHSLFMTVTICSVSFFCFPIFSVIKESDSLSKTISFLFSYLRDLILSRRDFSRSLISLALKVERLSMMELWLGATQPDPPWLKGPRF